MPSPTNKISFDLDRCLRAITFGKIALKLWEIKKKQIYPKIDLLNKLLILYLQPLTRKLPLAF